MSSREQILQKLRRNAPAPAALPDAFRGVEYDDPAAQFQKVFEGIGGHCLRIPAGGSLTAAFNALEVVANASQVASLCPELAGRSMDLSAVRDPHELASLDVVVLHPEFGVAENGAVWLPQAALGEHRAVFVIAQHVVLVMEASQIVSNMHQAYTRVRMQRPGFGVFLAGPSKTADIEQSLVIGAHGARSCTAILMQRKETKS